MEFVGESYIKVCFNIKNNVNGNQRIASEDNALLAFDGLPHSLIHFYRAGQQKKFQITCSQLRRWSCLQMKKSIGRYPLATDFLA